MKTKALLLGMLLLVTFSISAKRYYVSGTIKGGGGCLYTYDGWIDIDLFPPSVGCYDISVSSSNCDFKDHFSNC